MQRLESIRAVKANHPRQIMVSRYPSTALCDIREGQILRDSVCEDFSNGWRNTVVLKTFCFVNFSTASHFKNVEMRVCPTKRWGGMWGGEILKPRWVKEQVFVEAAQSKHKRIRNNGGFSLELKVHNMKLTNNKRLKMAEGNF